MSSSLDFRGNILAAIHLGPESLANYYHTNQLWIFHNEFMQNGSRYALT